MNFLTVKHDARMFINVSLSFRDFFNLSDGIFTNYNWSIPHLERTSTFIDKNYPNRRNDVYFGIDVFGRGQIAGFRSFEVMNDDLSVLNFALTFNYYRLCPRYQRSGLVLRYLHLVGLQKLLTQISDLKVCRLVLKHSETDLIRNSSRGTIDSGVHCCLIPTCSDHEDCHLVQASRSGPARDFFAWEEK